MRRNMIDWKIAILSIKDRKAMPIMTYPGLALTGNTIMDMVTDGEIQYNCIKALSDRYPTLASATLIMDLSVEAELFGSKIRYLDNEIPTVSERLINTLTKIQNLRIPKIGEGRSIEYLKAAKLSAMNSKDRPSFGGIIGPFSLAGRLFDITEIMTAILTEPDRIHELLKICTEFLKVYAKSFRDAGSNGVVIAEPAAGLLSPELCDEFSSIYVKQIVDCVQDENFLVMLHNCGHTTNLVKSMHSTGCMALHFGNAVDMRDILPQVKEDILVLGNLDPVGVFKIATPETVFTETINLLEETKDYNNFIISSGCDIPPNTPLDNIDSFFKAIDEFNSF
jgi:uroporphyrinogen decarboxylase